MLLCMYADDAPVYIGHSLFNIKKNVTLFIAQLLLHCNPANTSNRSQSR